MYYRIEPVYFILPVLSAFFSFVGCGNNKKIKIFLSLLFILLYSFSLNGSDYSGYRYLYKAVAGGASLSDIHGELGYYYLMKLFIRLGADYSVFRVVLLSVTSIVLFYSIGKLSKNFALSVFFVSTMFIVYTISTYRQFIVMAFSILLIYKYTKGRVKLSIIGHGILILFHPTAVLPLLCLLFYHMVYKSKTFRHTNYIRKNYIMIIFVALCLRIIVTGILLYDPVKKIVSALLMGRATATPTLFSFGLVSRLTFLFFVSYLYQKAGYIETATRILFWYYFVSIILYIIIPLEFTMGRLMNNASIIMAILVPVLRFDYDRLPDRIGMIRINWVRTVIVLLEVFALVILTNQLVQQDGYTPYLNILRGDKPIILQQYNIDQ